MHSVNFYNLPPGYGRLKLSRRRGESLFIGDDLLIVEAIKPDGVYIRIVDEQRRTRVERLSPGEWFRLNGLSCVSVENASVNTAKVLIASPRKVDIARSELRTAA